MQTKVSDEEQPKIEDNEHITYEISRLGAVRAVACGCPRTWYDAGHAAADAEIACLTKALNKAQAMIVRLEMKRTHAYQVHKG